MVDRIDIPLSAHLREAVDHLELARDRLDDAGDIRQREVVLREIAAAQTSLLRVLHLIGG